ncbi:hypothetical protein K458DRAFT_391569 [Lentithecium fluviatile CBS 122367]|uniref:Uncharacterized protein n=1 Tax=Lentithecium fluviatile CBS 122367 TaxID=1168545 RepID=A0A6G1ITM7_9PLEO|nr:hypothetical protein K458DRAFT_391569 [Lentithecium fluviatile CBS 122367]
MEALAAVGLASNVVQFVDFAGKIVSQTIRIYRERPRDPAIDDSDEEAPSSHLEKITSDLEQFNKHLTQSLDTCDPNPAKLSSSDKEIVRICRECQKITDSLLAALRKLRRTNKKLWSSFVAALRTVWSEGEINELRQTLDSYRQQITLHILASVREEIRSLQQMRTERDENLLTTVEETRSTVQALLRATSIRGEWKEEVIEAMHDDYKHNGTSNYLRASPAVGMESQLNDEDSRRFNEGLLGWIRFTELDNRHEKISVAYEQTFEWIFHNPPNNEWSDFTSWLRDDHEQLYWMTGKPAAGKSTMMKFIYSDPRTKKYLRHWAKGKQLIFCAFYFWNSGTQMQVSEEGLARTLLHSALSQAPNLWSRLFPHHMEEYVAYRNPWRKPITWDAILRAFRLLVDGAGDDYKLFFLIDGLDEYGDDHKKIIDMIQGFISPHVKTCVSSRPWNIFQDSFQQRPSLKLEDMTYKDIKLYVGDRFRRSRGFEERRSETPKEANQLIENITQKASGVFLWVALVTDSLLEGLADGERLSDLQARLDSLPTDLETLFWNILSRLPDAHLVRTSQLIQMVRASLGRLDLLLLSYADEDDPEYALKFLAGPRSIAQANARATILRRRLNACCKGLIESKPTVGRPLAQAQVGYLHRTVKDYVEREDNWSRFVSMTNGPFNPYIRLCNAHIVMLKISPRSVFDEDHRGLWFWQHVTKAMQYAKRVDTPGSTGLQTKLLNELDVSASRLATLKHETRGRAFIDDYAERFCPWVQIKHWTATHDTACLNQTFLHLAVQCHLREYVRAITPSYTSKAETLALALLISVVSDGISLPETPWLRKGHPDPKLVTLLLETGADPNLRIANAQLYTSHEDHKAMSPWGAYLASSRRGPEKVRHRIILAFLEHGADPKLGKKAGNDIRLLVHKYKADKKNKKVKRISLFFWKEKEKA